MIFEVTPIRDKERLESLYTSSGLPLPAFPFGMDMRAGEDAGYALFEIDHDAACISLLYAQAPDPALLDATIRSGFAAGEQMGCQHVDLGVGMPADMEARLLPLGYTRGHKSMDDFFGQCPSSQQGI